MFAVAAVLVACISSFALPLWLSVDLLTMAQFPWRLLSVLSLALALLGLLEAGYHGLRFLSERRGRELRSLLLGVVAVVDAALGQHIMDLWAEYALLLDGGRQGVDPQAVIRPRPLFRGVV